jgi:hypothetical protein
MSEFEMASMHATIYSAIQASLTVFITVLSGFLVMSYLVAHRLTRTMAVLGATTYGGFLIFNVLGTSGMLLTYAKLSEQMQAYANTGKGLAWHGAADMPIAVIYAMQPLFLIAGLLVVLGSLVFFAHCRRANRQAEAAAQPATA